MNKHEYMVEILEKFMDTPIKFKCKAISEDEIINRFKLNGSDISSYKITYIKTF